MEARKNSRKLAVQAVFQFFFTKEDIDKILEQFTKLLDIINTQQMEDTTIYE